MFKVRMTTLTLFFTMFPSDPLKTSKWGSKGNIAKKKVKIFSPFFISLLIFLKVFAKRKPEFFRFFFFEVKLWHHFGKLLFNFMLHCFCYCYSDKVFLANSLHITWDKVFKNGTSEICGRQSLKNLKWYGLLKQTISLQIF